MTEALGLVSEWPYRLWTVVIRSLVQSWLVGGTVGDVDLEERILPIGLVRLGKGSRCNLVSLL